MRARGGTQAARFGLAIVAACGSSVASNGATSRGAGGASAAAASVASASTSTTTSTSTSSGSGGADLDGDGLSDALEGTLASDYFPYLAIHPKDKCPRHGVLFRATPHPAAKQLVALWYDVLYEKDCGANGHAGDDEVFSTLVDPAKKPPAGVLAVRAISHQGTPCEHTSNCGTLPGCKACDTAMKGGVAMPVVYPSVDKHGSYVDKGFCDTSLICDFGGCALAAAADAPVLVNAGEPKAPLVHDLTTQGFITAANGWSDMTLFHFDPWGGKNFGGAGSVTGDLGDNAFLIDPAGCQ